MIVEALGKKYQIGFCHTEKPKRKREKRMTMCFIYELNTDKKERVIATSSQASCSSKDQFNKEEGRKRALTRALQQLWPSTDGTDHNLRRQVRTLFWNVYFHRNGHKNAYR